MTGINRHDGATATRRSCKISSFVDNQTTMNAIIENMLQGVRDNFSLLSHSSYHFPNPDGFAEDARALRGDAISLAKDMNHAVQTYEQNNRRQR
ncbi:hypothetical protein AGMMS49545_08080 [Betaproteobacteria bacterium]|nr:hypothetical protein AGMMS49545_08080 [Betaproteobacteria bacterium]GHU40506.1 hypothetical protein AGMMS50289_02160 [Betaproteobacteria bacterium]